MTILQAKKFTNEKFSAPGGYIEPTGWSVINTETGEWATFDNECPYIPRGGRKVCVEVAAECNPQELNYIAPLQTEMRPDIHD